MHYLGSFVLQDTLLSLHLFAFYEQNSKIFREHACILYCYVPGCLLRTVYIMGLLVTDTIFSFICPHAVFLRRRRSSWGGGGYSQKNWVGVCGLLPKTPTPCMTKICDIPYPDLTKKIETLLITCFSRAL